MKICPKCKLTKDITDFSRNTSWCKPCKVKSTQERNKTPLGVVNMVYANQRMTSRKMGRPEPNYTHQELRDWVFNQPNWTALYNAWVASGYDKYIKPSCDRINSSLPYTLNNLQLVTFTENMANQARDSRKGMHLGRNGVAVRQLTKTGEIVAEYPSISLAMRSLNKETHTGYNISSVCKGIWKTAYGYKWEYI